MKSGKKREIKKVEIRTSLPVTLPVPRYKRILIKLSGESLGDPATKSSIHQASLLSIAEQINEVRQRVQVAVVVGGGNIFRGVMGSKQGIDPGTSDYMGMLATIMNTLALQDTLEKIGVPTRVQSALSIEQVAERFIRRRAVRHLEKGRVVIFGGGTGNPYFTTDTAAALRATEIKADIILKATTVDAIYNKDPRKKENSDAKPYKQLTYEEALFRRLDVMDATAFALCQKQQVPIIVFDFFKPGNLKRVVNGEAIGTLVTG